MSLLHFAAQAERPQIGPRFFDEGEALGLGAALAAVAPPGGQLPVGGPDRILLLVVAHNTVRGLVGIAHGRTSRISSSSGASGRSAIDSSTARSRASSCSIV